MDIIIFLSTLFIEANSSLLILESVKALEIKTSMLFNLDFAKNTILSCFFVFFLIIDINFLIPAAIVQMFTLIVELVISIGILSKEAKAETEIHRIIVDAKIKQC